MIRRPATRRLGGGARGLVGFRFFPFARRANLCALTLCDGFGRGGRALLVRRRLSADSGSAALMRRARPRPFRLVLVFVGLLGARLLGRSSGSQLSWRSKMPRALPERSTKTASSVISMILPKTTSPTPNAGRSRGKRWSCGRSFRSCFFGFVRAIPSLCRSPASVASADPAPSDRLCAATALRRRALPEPRPRRPQHRPSCDADGDAFAAHPRCPVPGGLAGAAFALSLVLAVVSPSPSSPASSPCDSAVHS